jgi:hypothetical protein
MSRPVAKDTIARLATTRACPRSASQRLGVVFGDIGTTLVLSSEDL